MTVQALPWCIQGQEHEAEIARVAMAAVFGVPVAAHTVGSSITTAGGGHGVVGSGDLAVTQNGTPNMSVNVAAGAAVIRAGYAGNITGGVYSLLNDATVNVVISAADGTNPRRDLVIAQARDNSDGGDAAADARIVVVAGTPAASPSDPSLTAYPNALVLARVAVAAGATSITTANITDLRTRASALGAPLFVANYASLPTGASLYAGLEAVTLDTMRVWRYSGTAWVFVDWTPGIAGGQPGVVLTDAAQSIGTASSTDITWGTEGSDVDGWHSGTSETVTVPTGWGGRPYLITFSGVWASTSLGTTPQLWVSVNGNAVAGAAGLVAVAAHSVTIVRTLADADAIICKAYQNSGGSVNFTGRLEITPV